MSYSSSFSGERFVGLIGSRGRSLRHGHPPRPSATAVRALRAHAGLTLTIVAILAIAIGANTAVFALVDVTLLAPLPFPDDIAPGDGEPDARRLGA